MKEEEEEEKKKEEEDWRRRREEGGSVLPLPTQRAALRPCCPRKSETLEE